MHSALALLFFVASALLFSGGQQIRAWYSPFDDLYFLWRSGSFSLQGSHLAPIKEALYPAFVSLVRRTGAGLRPAEAALYGAACWALWLQMAGLAKSRAMAWATMLPLAFFAYQHPVFNRSTYDALQLILLPLTFAAAIALYRSRGAGLALSGVVAGLHVVNRPEGALFALPPLMVLACLAWEDRPAAGGGAAAGAFLRRTLLLLAWPLLFHQAACALNYRQFGFWGPTTIKSRNFSRACRGLMAVRTPPTSVSKVVPVTREALELAFQASPALRRAKPYFDANLGGRGWSGAWHQDFAAQQGNIDGGHFQWALLEAGAFACGDGEDGPGAFAVVQLPGPDPRQLNDYFGRVAAELEMAFAKGRLQRRPVAVMALGPEFTPFSAAFLHSGLAVAKPLLALTEVPYPERSGPDASAEVERDFDRLALRGPPALGPFKISARITKAFYSAMRRLIPLSLLLWVGLLGGLGPGLEEGQRRQIMALAAMGLSLAFARWALFSAIDSCMFWGREPRYLAAGAFSLWFFAAGTLALLVQGLLARRPGGGAMGRLDRHLRDTRIGKALACLPQRSERVLDIGCGDGHLLGRLEGTGARLEGLDPRWERAWAGTARMVRGSFPQDLAEAGFKGPYDAILATAVFEHFDEEGLKAAAEAVPALLRPGGRLIITVPEPKVDRILDVLVALRLAEGTALEEHHGFQPARLPGLFPDLRLVEHRRFQLGLNNLYVFERPH